MIVFSHPTGNANSRAAIAGIASEGLLSRFHTSIASFPNSAMDHLSRIGPLREIRRRRFDASLKTLTHSSPWREFGRFAATIAGFNRLISHETGPFCIDAVYRGIDLNTAASLQGAVKKRARAIYGYEDAALNSFQEAKRIGLQCFYDLPIGYWRAARRILETERLRWPEWAPTLTGFNDSVAKLARKDEELALADVIFVASRFTAETLKEYPGKLKTIEVIPYGFPSVDQPRQYHTTSEKLKLLFVGGLSQRKGLAYLFEAIKKFERNITLTIVGGKPNLDPTPALDAALKKHRWISSLPHDEILELMREQDVLIFPSLFEGFGLVITEAMSQGTPVITTECTAGPDIIQHGINGWLTRAGSAEALEEVLENLLSNRKQIGVAGKQAMETARKRPWTVYGQELATSIKKHLEHKDS
jgi:glycosyltransferase involved in cell wall biosynthesis